MKSYLNSYFEFIYEFSALQYREIVAEFLEMNSYMNHSWIHWSLTYSGFSFKSVSVREKFSLIQSNHDPAHCQSAQVTALSLLCCCCCLMATTAYSRRLVLLHTPVQGGCGWPFEHIMDVTDVKICLACLSAMEEILETFKSRGYQRDQSQGHYSKGAFRPSEVFQAGEGRGL